MNPNGLNPFRVMQAAAASSVVWLLGWGWYISVYLGWGDLLYLLPHELGAFLAGIFAPLAFVWLAVAYLTRTDELRETTQALRHELSLLTYPPDEAEEKVNAITEALHRQAQELANVSERAATQTQAMRDGLQR